MLDCIPDDVAAYFWQFLSQQDRVKLTTLNRSSYKIYSQKLYKNLFLNRLPVYDSDTDINDFKIFTKWSYLVGSLSTDDLRSEKNGSNPNKLLQLNNESLRADFIDPLSLLLRTFSKNPSLLTHVENVYCTWHIDKKLKYQLLDLLAECVGHANMMKGEVALLRGGNLISFENNLDFKVFEKLHLNCTFEQNRWTALDIPPITPLPNSIQDIKKKKKYLSTAITVLSQSAFQNVQTLTLHFNPIHVFPLLNKKLVLNVKNLCLNFRPDKLENEHDLDQSKTARLVDFFNPDYLEKLDLVSWHETTHKNFYQKNGLLDAVVNFPNIKHMKLASLPYSETFVKLIFKHWNKLNYLHLDFFIEPNNFNHSFFVDHKPSFHDSLHYLFVRISDELVPKRYSVTETNAQGAVYMKPAATSCLCKSCVKVHEEIIEKYYFRSNKTLIPINEKTVSQKDYTNHIFQRFSILPYCANVLNEDYPPVGYGTHTLSQCSKKIHELHSAALQKSCNKLNWWEIRALYFYTYHQYARSFNTFLGLFRNLRVLNINDVPSRIVGSRNYPLFLTQNTNYTSNQGVDPTEIAHKTLYEIESVTTQLDSFDVEEELVREPSLNSDSDDSDFDW
ncbi:hypothetical protein ACO0RG_002538 [Hanseniaspora osmophila]